MGLVCSELYKPLPPSNYHSKQKKSHIYLKLPSSPPSTAPRTSQVALVVKNPLPRQERCKRHGFDPWVGKILWRRAWQPTQVFLPGESHGQKSLAGYSPRGSQRVGHNWSDLAQHSPLETMNLLIFNGFAYSAQFIYTESYDTWVFRIGLFPLACQGSFIHAVACYELVLHPFCDWMILHCTDTPLLLIHPFVGGCLGCFHLLTIVNNAGMNVCVQVFVRTYVFNSLGYITQSGIAGSSGNFNSLRNCQIVFHSCWTILHSHQQCEGSVPPHSWQHLLFSALFDKGHPRGQEVVAVLSLRTTCL